MIPIDILKRIAELVFGQIADEVQRRRNPRSRLVRDLLEYYDTLKDYRLHAFQLLQLLERERLLVPSKRLTPGTAKKAKQLLDALGVKAETLVDLFGHELTRSLQPLIDKRREEAKRRRRSTVLEVMDSELAALVSEAHMTDFMTSPWHIMAKHHDVSWDRQEISYLAADNQSSPKLLSGIRSEMWASDPGARPNSSFSDIPPECLRIIQVTNDVGFQQFVDHLRQNIATVEALTDKVAGFLKANFSMEDLLR